MQLSACGGAVHNHGLRVAGNGRLLGRCDGHVLRRARGAECAALPVRSCARASAPPPGWRGGRRVRRRTGGVRVPRHRCRAVRGGGSADASSTEASNNAAVCCDLTAAGTAARHAAALADVAYATASCAAAIIAAACAAEAATSSSSCFAAACASAATFAAPAIDAIHLHAAAARAAAHQPGGAHRHRGRGGLTRRIAGICVAAARSRVSHMTVMISQLLAFTRGRCTHHACRVRTTPHSAHALLIHASPRPPQRSVSRPARPRRRVAITGAGQGRGQGRQEGRRLLHSAWKCVSLRSQPHRCVRARPPHAHRQLGAALRRNCRDGPPARRALARQNNPNAR